MSQIYLHRYNVLSSFCRNQEKKAVEEVPILESKQVAATMEDTQETKQETTVQTETKKTNDEPMG